MCLPYSVTPRTPPRAPLFCYITDRTQFAGTAQEQERQLLKAIAECAAAGVDYIQLREKDLPVRSLEVLAGKAVAAIPAGSPSRLLINSRTDVALACGAHGVHLPSRSLPASEVRATWARSSRSTPIVGVSTHSAEEVASAEAHGADFAVFAPVFEKSGAANPAGLDQLREVCCRPPITGTPMPVLALGGITLENARLCLQAGAAGIAGIRLFQQGEVAESVRNLRSVFADV